MEGKSISFYVDKPEKVKCNTCGVDIPGEGERNAKVYILVDEDDKTFGYPRCKECLEKDTTEDRETKIDQIIEDIQDDPQDFTSLIASCLRERLEEWDDSLVDNWDVESERE